MTRPWKVPPTARSRSGRDQEAIEAGPSPSAGTSTCAVITASSQGAIRQGARCSASNCAGPRSIRGRAVWESVAVAPWPGKCFAQVPIPASISPVAKARACRATRSGSSP